MNLGDIMAIIESKRLELSIHKTTLASKAGISTTYYNELIKGGKHPAFDIVISLLSAVGLRIFVLNGVLSEL